MGKIGRTDLEKWDAVDPIRIVDAAYLWDGLAPPGDDKPAGTQTHVRCEVLLSAFRNNSGIADPLLRDRHSCAEYKRIAENFIERPSFLYPEDRRKKTGQKHEINYIMQTKNWPITRAAEKVASTYNLRPSTVERGYRRHRDQLKTQRNSQYLV